MNTLEKLEQSSIVKEKGTQYFKVEYAKKVAIKNLKTDLYFFMFSNAIILYPSGGKIQAGISSVQKDCVMAGT